MSLTISLQLIAGLSALALGAAVVYRGPVRSRNRSFALLSLAFAIWHLGHSGLMLTGRIDIWRPILMVGSLAAAPLGIDFALTLCGRSWRHRRRPVLSLTVAAGLVWLIDLAASLQVYPTAIWFTLPFLSVTLVVALGIILRQAMALGDGPGRRALLGVFFGALLLVIGGLSDLIPWNVAGVPDFGAIATLVFLAIVCAVVLRHHLLDIDGFVLRAVGTLTLSSSAAALLWVGYRRIGESGFASFFLVGLIVIVPVILAAPYLRLRTRSILQVNDPLIHQLSEISGRLPRVTRRQEVLDLFDEANGTLPPPIRLELLLEIDGVLTELLQNESFLTLRFLNDALIDAGEDRRRLLKHAETQMTERSWDLLFSMSGEHKLVGALAVGGPLPERYLTEAVSAAGAALANQTASCFERFDAIEATERDKSIVAIGKVAAGLAHEIRNPLAALRGAGQAMGASASPEQRATMLKVINEESARLESFVREFLEFAIPKTLNRTTVDLEKLSRDAVRASHAAGHVFSVDWEFDRDLPPIPGDPELLRRVFDNLVRNAREAAEGDVMIKVTLRRSGHNAVEWSVEDDGPGITDGRIDRMTEPYFTTKTAGTGLGLAMVQRVIEQHDGQLTIANRAEGGARISMTLPINNP